MKGMKFYFGAMIAFAIALAIAGCSSDKNNESQVKTVKTGKVTLADETMRLDYPGKVKAAQDISLAFKVSGTLEKFHVEEGQKVRAGQLLAHLDPTDYQVQLDATEAEYQQIKADAERIMALYEEDVATASDNDKAVYGLQQITAKRKHHQDELNYTRLTAPFDGTVQKKLFEEHETLGAGTPVISMVSAGLPEIEINIPASEYVKRETFRQFTCSFEVYPERTYSLKLISISPKANSNQLYTMRLQVVKDENPTPAPGMNTMVSIVCSEEGEQQKLAVPTSALVSKDGRSEVFLYDAAAGKVRAKSVNMVQLLSNGKAVIEAEGLNVGDVVVTAGVHFVSDGETVKCLEAVTESNVGNLL